jgi:hypothetical protein
MTVQRFYENMTLGLHSVRLSACLAPYIATARYYLCSAILSPSTVSVVVLLTLLLSQLRSSSDGDLTVDSAFPTIRKAGR